MLPEQWVCYSKTLSKNLFHMLYCLAKNWLDPNISDSPLAIFKFWVHHIHLCSSIFLHFGQSLKVAIKVDDGQNVSIKLQIYTYMYTLNIS